MLVHRDPSLSVPLLVTSDTNQIERGWQMWSEMFALPQIEEENDVGSRSLRRAVVATTSSKAAVQNFWCAGKPVARNQKR